MQRRVIGAATPAAALETLTERLYLPLQEE
jgi:hypothetical protein